MTTIDVSPILSPKNRVGQSYRWFTTKGFQIQLFFRKKFFCQNPSFYTRVIDTVEMRILSRKQYLNTRKSIIKKKKYRKKGFHCMKMSNNKNFKITTKRPYFTIQAIQAAMWYVHIIVYTRTVRLMFPRYNSL